MKILVVLPECGFSNTSSSIFSEMFLSKLSAHYAIDVVGFDLPDEYMFGVNRPGFIRRYIPIRSRLVCKRAPIKPTLVKGEPEHRCLSKLKGIGAKVAKLIVPDFFALGVIDGSFSEEQFGSYDYIISMSDPKSAHYLALCLRKKIDCLARVTYIQIWGDPWYHDITRRTLWINKVLEKSLINKANLVFYRSEATLYLQTKTFPSQSGIMNMLHRGFSGPEIKDETIEVFKSGFSFLYAGDYNPNVRNIVTFARLVGEYGSSLTLYGNTLPSCKKKLATLKGVSQFSRVPKGELERAIEEHDCLVIALNLSGSQLPGKVYDVIPIKKPVLLLIDGDVKLDVIPALDRFVSIKNNEVSIRSFLDNLVSLQARFHRSMNKYHIDNVVRSFKERIEMEK